MLFCVLFFFSQGHEFSVVVVFSSFSLGLIIDKISAEFHYLGMVKFNFNNKQLMATQKSTSKQLKNKDFFSNLLPFRLKFHAHVY